MGKSSLPRSGIYAPKRSLESPEAAKAAHPKGGSISIEGSSPDRGDLQNRRSLERPRAQTSERVVRLLPSLILNRDEVSPVSLRGIVRRALGVLSVAYVAYLGASVVWA